MSDGYKLDPSYKQVPERIADLKAKYPDATLQPADPTQPYRVEQIEGRCFVVYTAACFRSPDDPRPGIGVAWEPFPGRTPYTRDSELQNAETSAWGRAIVAALASESKAIASAEDVRNRTVERDVPAASSSQSTGIATGIAHLTEDGADALKKWWAGQGFPSLKSGRLTEVQADEILLELRHLADEFDPEVPT